MKKLINFLLIKSKHEIVNIKDLFKFFLYKFLFYFILFYLYIYFYFEFKDTKELEEN